DLYKYMCANKSHDLKTITRIGDFMNSELEIAARRCLVERGVTLKDIAELVYFLQSKYHDDLTMDVCTEHVNYVLAKREVQNAIFGLAIVNIYGSIGFTNYGYVDKIKPGILEHLNDTSSGECHTFLDDIVGAIAAAASSRLAHAAADHHMLDE